jgi:hypothetical protein
MPLEARATFLSDGMNHPSKLLNKLNNLNNLSNISNISNISNLNSHNKNLLRRKSLEKLEQKAMRLSSKLLEKLQ